MADEKIKQKLAALATEQQLSNFRRLKDLLPDIEAAFEAGATRKAVVAVLKSEGLDITPETFSVYMGRLKNTPSFEPTPPDSKK
jgi:hypothetical protein